MIVIDSSAIIAILLAEAEEPTFRHIIAQEEVLIGAPTVCETRKVLESRLPGHAGSMLKALITGGGIQITSFDEAMTEAAINAFSIYGKGFGHPAKLNFGDYLSYAVAKVYGLPLLFKGNDFIHTDLVPACGPSP